MIKARRCFKFFKLRLITIASIMLMLLVIGLSWLAAGIFVSFAVYFILICYLKIRKSYFLSSILLVLTIVVSGTLLKVFVFEIFNVPSQSMENLLHPGDKIIVSKLHYGPMLPSTLSQIPWLNLFFEDNQESSDETLNLWKKHIRLSGFSKIKHNDVMVCKPMGVGKEFLVKRCVGLPSDKLEIDDNVLSINGIAAESAPTVRLDYRLYVANTTDFIKMADSIKLVHYVSKSKKSGWTNITLSFGELRLLQQKGLVDSLRHSIKYQRAFPNNDQFNWTYSNLGPLVIPFVNLTIPVNRSSYSLYESLFRGAEKANISELNGRYYLNGRQISHYTFRNDYYFFLGDNRNNSKDSRDWGLLSAQEIEGKVVCIIDVKKKDFRKVF